MANPLREIRQPVAAELAEFEQRFRSAMHSQVPLLDRITYYIVRRKGKQVRPLFVFLCAQLCGGVTNSTYHAAALIELLHTASLVHDDVVDDADQRRGFFSVNALWKNKVAVLVGDYLFSKGMLLALRNKEFELLEIVSNAVQALTEGELLQIEKARRLDIEEDAYYQIIRQKTASLIASACKAGAAATTDDLAVRDRMHQMGEYIGIAFQIRDDLFDFGTDDVGKPLGIDIKEKKMTLPLIYAIKQGTRKDRRWVLNSIRRYNKDITRVREIIEFVREKGGLEYAEKAMYEYRDRALELLYQSPDMPARDSLEALVRYVTERKK